MEEDGYLLNSVDTVRHIPATIINGRYDMVTPIKTAWELHKVFIRFSDKIVGCCFTSAFTCTCSISNKAMLFSSKLRHPIALITSVVLEYH